MSEPNDNQAQRQMLADATNPAAKLSVYLKLSGPGWLQSAITLGGGSLASSLFLGILAGFSLLWVQPLAMILGIIMLSAIGYVTLSTGERPFVAIRDHINPVLAWGWALAVAAANIVWCMPQFALAKGVVMHNLLPSLFSPTIDPETDEAIGVITRSAGESASVSLISLVILFVTIVITWSYGRGGWGIRMYERLLKVLVALIVLCFAAVVYALSTSEVGLDWDAIVKGLIPNPSQFFNPAETFLPMLDSIGAEGTAARDYWSGVIVSKQQDVIIAAAATAVGINMTFLFPYSMLRKGWTKEFRGLAIFDLSTGMFIPYVLATGCVVIAASAQFHTKITDDFIYTEDGNLSPPKRFEKPYTEMLELRGKDVDGEISLAEKKIAATLVNRKAGDLAGALKPLSGNFVANIVFGVGVLAMAMSTISLLMLISGFVFCEMFGVPAEGEAHRIGTLPVGIIGAFGPFIWGSAAASAYMAVPTSVFGFVLLPFAYVTFFFLMNQKKLLGENAPQGGKKIVWNTLMGIAATVATAGSLYMIHKKTGNYGFIAVGAFVLLAVIVHFIKKPSLESTKPRTDDR